VTEGVSRFFFDDPGLEKMGEVTIEGDLSQTDDDADAREGFDLTGEVGGAVSNLLRGGFVSGRSTTDDRGDPGVAEFKAVVAGDASGLIGEAHLVEDGIHEVAGAIAGEGAASAVGSVGTGGEAEDENAGTGVPEAGNGAGPVGLILVGTALDLSDSAAIVAEAGAAFAVNDGFANLEKEWGRYLFFNAYHCISMIMAIKLRRGHTKILSFFVEYPWSKTSDRRR
jgi:hypothetical protein